MSTGSPEVVDSMDKVVLCVDDEAPILTMYEQLFKSCGYSPRCSIDGEEALRILEQEHIRVVFTDLRMPKMDGMTLCRRVKDIAPDAQVFAVSAYVDANSEDQFREAGFTASFGKPFNMKELLAACAKAFEDIGAAE